MGQVPGWMEPQTGENRDMKTTALAEVNRHIVEVARRSESAEPEWDFFCECGRRDCREQVSLTIDAYSAIRDARGAVLARGHAANPVVRARQLREESRALRAQANHQAKRAHRLGG